MSVKLNDRVTLPGYYGEIGTVSDILTSDRYPERVLIVSLNDGTKRKVFERDAVLIRDEDPPENGDSITITRDEFRKAVCEITDPKNFRQDNYNTAPYLIAMSGLLVCDMLEHELFGELKNDQTV